MNTPQNYPVTPKHLWECFHQITQVPRPSHKESKAIRFLKDFAKRRNLKWATDSADNVIIYVPGTRGKENNSPVIIQNHIDMVCDKLPEKKFDFENEPIETYVKEGWIHAKGTTLGADNGFGCAMALALTMDESVEHPPLELLFTTAEETGLSGALNVDASLLKGRKMINLDTEEWGAIYIGCAGGIDAKMYGQTFLVKAKPNFITCDLQVLNLKGGHSGLDIHRGRLNALKVLSQILWSTHKLDYSIATIKAGKAHNIIPRDAFCQISLAKEDFSKFQKICDEIKTDLMRNALSEDHDLEINLVKSPTKRTMVLSKKERDRIINLLNLFPHGAYNYDWNLKEALVTYSSNFAIFKLEENNIFIETSIRYIDPAEIKGLKNQLEGLAFHFQLTMEMNDGYPSWKPVHDNRLLDLAKKQFDKQFGYSPAVKAIHAGLECGILKNKIGPMDIISIGPNITGAHSPSERLEIESSNKLWQYMTGLLKEL